MFATQFAESFDGKFAQFWPHLSSVRFYKTVSGGVNPGCCKIESDDKRREGEEVETGLVRNLLTGFTIKPTAKVSARYLFALHSTSFVPLFLSTVFEFPFVSFCPGLPAIMLLHVSWLFFDVPPLSVCVSKSRDEIPLNTQEPCSVLTARVSSLAFR